MIGRFRLGLGGSQEFAVLQSFFIMVDREDGTEWYLTHRSSDDRVAISDVAPSRALRADVARFGPYDGPWIGHRTPLRLFVRDGRLGYDVPDVGGSITDLSAAKVTTRRSWQRYALEIYAQDEWAFPGDTLGYRLIAGTSMEADVD